MMTRRDAVILASRALALYLFAWGLNDLSYVPQTVVSLRHHYSVLSSNDYWFSYYGLELLVRIGRLAALFVTAAWLYACGPRVQRFFLPVDETASTDEPAALSNNKTD